MSYCEWLKCSGWNPFITQLCCLLPRCIPVGFISRKAALGMSDLQDKQETSCDKKYLLVDLYHQRQSWNFKSLMKYKSNRLGKGKQTSMRKKLDASKDRKIHLSSLITVRQVIEEGNGIRNIKLLFSWCRFQWDIPFYRKVKPDLALHIREWVNN